MKEVCLGFRVYSLEFRVYSSGLRVYTREWERARE